jgi:RNA polymerase sigma-70 factor (ECF subfamily)
MDTCSDAEVIAASLGDPRLFAEIFDRHAAIVFRFLVRRVGRDTADDLLGETFRIAFQRRTSFDQARPNAMPWLYGIAGNLMSKHRRTEARRLHATARLIGTASHEPLADVVVAGMAARAIWPVVAAGIAELPDGERDALLLYAWEELSYEEIAVALEIPVGTVRSRLNRARRRLRELVGPNGKEHGQNQTPTAPGIEP